MKKLMNKKAIEAYCVRRADDIEEMATISGKRFNRERFIRKEALKIYDEWETATGQVDPTKIAINIEWKKSRTWGSTPHATAHIHYKDGHFLRLTSTCGGCGYDKESTVFAEILNGCMRGILIRACAKGIVMPYGVQDYSPGVFPPSFVGGMGMSCYDGSKGIIAAIGGKLENVASGSAFDAWTITYPAPRKRKPRGE